MTPENFPYLFDFIIQAEAKKRWAQMADLMRLEIVYHHGGYYFDMTFELTRNLTGLFRQTRARFVGCNEVDQPVNYLSNSFFGAVPKHPPILLLIQQVPDIDFDDKRINYMTGPFFLYKLIVKSARSSVRIWPAHYFYPYISWTADGRRASVDACIVAQRNRTRRSQSRSNSNKRQGSRERKIQIPMSGGRAVLYPCTAYPKSYANKHWEWGGTWLVKP